MSDLTPTRQARIDPRPRSAPSQAPDGVQATVRRLVAAVWIVTTADLVYVVLYGTIWLDVSDPIARNAALAAIVASVAFVVLLRRRTWTETALTQAAFAYQALLCLSIALSEYSVLQLLERPADRISWTCVFIVFFHALVPASPRTVLLGSLAAASMNGVALAIAVGVIGRPEPTVGQAVSLLLPPVICAAIAFGQARVVCQLRTELRRVRRLGSYELEDRLGSGGMGEVWRARHRLLVRPAAVKLIRPEALGRDGGTDVVERFRREAQATALLESPHTVELYDYGVTEDGTCYHVMELLHGIDLDGLVRRFGPQPPERVVHLLRQACDSLADAHACGLIHRDVKPANLYLSRKRRQLDFLKVLDFGLVKQLGPVTTEGVHATREGLVPGTPAYLPPEALTGDEPLDGRSDLYALGCVAWWLLVGRPVFEAKTPVKMALAHTSTLPEPPSRHAPGPVAPDLDALVLACLEKDPERRPPDADTLAAHLDETGLGPQWTQERAADWWEEHLADTGSSDAAALAAVSTPRA